MSDVKVSTSKDAQAAKPAQPKNEARKVNVEAHPAASDERLAALDVFEADTKSDGTINGLKPHTKYRLIEVDADSKIEVINPAALAGNKIRKGVLITKIIEVEDED